MADKKYAYCLDYRFAPGEETYGNIELQKEELIKRLRKNCVNHYHVISDNNRPYKSSFINIFRDRCCYCGRHVSLIGSEQFQIDHRIPLDESDNICGCNLNHIDNLYLSCPSCNYKKRDKIINMDNVEKFELNLLAKVFIREIDTFTLTISDCYKNDSDYLEFFNKLHFDSQKKRIDFIVNWCRYLLETRVDLNSEIRDCLGKIHRFLQGKRNLFTSD